MHDLLRPLEDLKEIKKSLGENTDNKTMKLIDTKIAEYESDIKAVEKFLKEESEKYDNSILDEVNTAHATESVSTTFFDNTKMMGHGELPNDVKVTYGDLDDNK